jgi:hypothetical protein
VTGWDVFAAQGLPPGMLAELDALLTANAGLAAISEFCDRLGVIEALDAAVGPIKAAEPDQEPGTGRILQLWRRWPPGHETLQ